MSLLYKKLGPLGPIFIFMLTCFTLFAINRIFLGYVYFDNLSSVEDFWRYIPIGMRTDTIILSLSLALPILLTLLIPIHLLKKIKFLLLGYLTFIFICFVFLEIASWPFLDQYSSRPNQLFFQYFSHPKEVLSMVWEHYAILTVITAIALFYIAKWTWKTLDILLELVEPWSYWRGLLFLPIIIPVIIVGARSGIGQANATPAIAAFSNDHLTNQLSLNASFSLSFAYYTEKNSAIRTQDLYGDMPFDEVISRVKKYMDVKAEDFTDPTIPTLHIQRPTVEREKPLNLVIIVMESLGSDFVESQGGKAGLTPNLDQLRHEGIFFDDIYAIGTRTSRGLEALVSGYLPTSKSSSVMKLDLAQHNFFTIAALLKQHGYKNTFLYGGEAHFDNMASFFLGNGFDKVIAGNDISSPEYVTSWGVSDEDVFNHANEMYKQQGDEPFLSVILTLSNHLPFDFPEGKIDLANAPHNTPENATKYSDYALGKFFAKAKQEAYYDNTVFLITGDHPMKIRAKHLVPIDKYRIPALIISPGLEPQLISRTGSQIDLLPTALGLLGMETEHPMTGLNLLKPSTTPSSTVMIYMHSLTFRTDNNVVIYQPEKTPQTFLLDENWQLTESESDPELEKDALAHILFPAVSYFEQTYKLPTSR